MLPPLRFAICGSVDDGKSTLIGRLLHECGAVWRDELSAVEAASRRYGTQGPATDLALLMDGLAAEREQAITIDVAHRRFDTPRRQFFVADTPGHEQYTRNAAVGLSLAELAVVLVDAGKGVVRQTGRHLRIAALFGVPQVVFAVNKMDRVGWDRDRFEAVAADCRDVARAAGVGSAPAIPLSALTGDNLARRGPNSPWYEGPTLLGHLETVRIGGDGTRAFRMPVQYVNRPDPTFRGYCGRIAAGAVAVGDRVRIAPSGAEGEVARIVAGCGDADRADRGESVTLVLKEPSDIGRGDVISAAEDPVLASDQFRARMLWMGDAPLVVGRPYRLKIHTREVAASVTRIRHRFDALDGRTRPAATLDRNDIGSVNIATDRPVPFAPYGESRVLGGFVLLDRRTGDTLAAGAIRFALRRAANLRWQDFAITKEIRASAKLQRPGCVWLTGLSGAGKSTIADLLERRLVAQGRHTYVLDGDNVRHGLNRDLGFTEADRGENVRRVAEVARLMVDAGLIVVVALLSPYRAERDYARSRFDPGDFREVFVDAPLATCEARDPKGLYAKARRGEVANLTGIGSPYEPPERPDLTLDTNRLSPQECVEQVLACLE